MNKLFKVFMVGFLVFTTLALAGCGEEKKYNELKIEVTKEIEQFDKIDTKGSDAEFNARFEAAKKPIEEKLSEMEKLATSDTKLLNDLNTFKEQKWKAKIDGLKGLRSIAKMRQEVTKTMPVDSLFFSH